MAVFSFISCNSGMKQETETYRNPIIPGFAPDPSICHVGDDFYLINSTSTNYADFDWFQYKGVSK
jgi:alpha-N-arabinofuranosidase